MHLIKVSHLIEPGAARIGFSDEGMEVVNDVTPLDLLIQKEEAEQADGLEATAAAISAIRRLMIKVFDGGKKHPIDALAELMLIAYSVDASLVGNKSLKDLAKIWDTSKQTFSKRLLKLNKELNVRSRNQKSATAVETYKMKTKAWHKAHKAEQAALEKFKEGMRKAGGDKPELG